MIDIFYALIFAAIWVFNVVSVTGWDSTYNISPRVRMVVLLLTCLKVLVRFLQGRRRLDRNEFIALAGMGITFLFSSLTLGYRWEAFEYLWVFLLVYLLSDIKMNTRLLHYIGIGYCVAGLLILYIYDYQKVISNWNENSIAMYGLYSYLIFLIIVYNIKNKKQKIFIVLVTFLYAKLIFDTKSRSGILFLFVGMLVALGIFSRDFFYRNHKRLRICLLIPLAVVVLVLLVSSSSIFYVLDEWSYATFQKPLLNGRNELYIGGLQTMWINPLFGIGSASTWNWHSSAIACLVGYGIVGFCFWIASFKCLLNRALAYISDPYIQGCIVGFLLIYIHQSVELGMISKTPNVLPYALLGILLGRVKYLKEEEEKQSQ